MMPVHRPHGNAVADRVLEQRLQDEGRHERPQRERLDVDDHVQPILIADLLQLHIAIDEGQLLLERDLLLAGMIE